MATLRYDELDFTCEVGCNKDWVVPVNKMGCFHLFHSLHYNIKLFKIPGSYNLLNFLQKTTQKVMVVDPLWNDLPIIIIIIIMMMMIIIIIIIIDIKNSLTISPFKNILFQESPLPLLRTIIIFLDWESHLMVLRIICFYISFCFCWLFQE